MANESKWLEGWFAAHQIIRVRLKEEEEEVFHAIYRHSATPQFSEEELLGKMDKTMHSLAETWRKRVKDAPYELGINSGEIAEVEKHIVGIRAILGQIKVSKNRMILSKHLGDILWPLGFTLLISLIVIFLCSITSIATFMSKNASIWAFGLILIAAISVFLIILVVALYIRAEVRLIGPVGSLKDANIKEE